MQLVYQKPFRITQDVTLGTMSDLRGQSDVVVKGNVRYQACDDKICFLPTTVPVSWTVKLTK